VRALLEDPLLDDQGSSPPPRLDIDPRDEMFRVSRELCHGNRDQALVDYYRAGRTAARTFGQVLEGMGGPQGRRNRPLRILDFAAGWGRVTRFLAAARPEARFTVADISPDAVRFQRQVLGLPGFVSSRRPQELVIPARGAEAGGDAGPASDGTFDAVLVASLFTHLPEGTFVPWLRRLFDHVAPGGVLAVSTHPDWALPPSFSMPASGLFYEEASEIPELDVAEYGRTWVTDAYVEGAISRALGPGHPHRVFRRALWQLQDLWVVPKEPSEDLSGLTVDGGPDGRLEGLSFEEDGSKLWLAGWAAHPLRDEPGVTVEVSVEGRTVARTRPDRPRPDVARRLGRGERVDCGWLVHVPFEDGRPGMSDRLLVKVVDRRGLEQVIHLSTLEGLVAWHEAKRLREELVVCQRELQRADGHLQVNAVQLRELEARVAAMEASRFWKLRNRWFRLKALVRKGGPGSQG